MKNQLANTNRISISNFTFEYAGELGYIVTFFSTKTNKCWKIIVSKVVFRILNGRAKNFNQKNLNLLKNLCKNGNN